LFTAILARAQETTISGIITDTKSKQAIPGVSVSLVGTSIGASTDINGHYVLKGNEKTTTIRFSFIGYKPVTKEIIQEKEQIINVAMSEDSRLLTEVVIKSGKKPKYRNKDNPASSLFGRSLRIKNQTAWKATTMQNITNMKRWYFF